MNDNPDPPFDKRKIVFSKTIVIDTKDLCCKRFVFAVKGREDLEMLSSEESETESFLSGKEDCVVFELNMRDENLLKNTLEKKEEKQSKRKMIKKKQKKRKM